MPQDVGNRLFPLSAERYGFGMVAEARGAGVEPSGRDLPRLALKAIRERLPAGWSVERVVEQALADGMRPDWVADLVGPDGSSARLVGECRRLVEARDIGTLAERLDRVSAGLGGAAGLVVARYLSPQTRARLAERGISFVDATGNVRLEVDKPALYLSDRGADADPWRGPGRPRGTLNGQPAAAIVRAITDFDRAWTAADLIRVAGVSTGAGYRVIDFLEAEGLVERPARGVVRVLDWAEILRRWSQDYGFARHAEVTRWIAPRGLDDLMARAAGSTGPRYAVTGTLAAAQWAAYAPARAAMVYVEDARGAAAEWGLRPAEAGANVMLGQPTLEVPFTRTVQRSDGLVLAAPAQVVVDLMTGPGRNPSEAEELLSWLQANETQWRVMS